MSKKVLIALSEHGFWVEELLKPIDRLDAAGIEYDFITPTGALPFPDGASLDDVYVDPPLGRPVTSKEMAERGKNADWEAMFANRFSLVDWMPLRPYLSAEGGYLQAMEKYYTQREQAWKHLDAYDAFLLVGGGGPIVDMVNNNRLHDLILGFYYKDRPIAAECYTVTCLAFSRELNTRKSILAGKHVTGHTMEYDYTSGWAILANGDYFSFESPPYPLEYILRDTVGPEGEFHGNVGRVTSVIVDYPFITSRSVASSDECGQKLVEVLNSGLRRYGW
jgi:putative intracellular protease/amidase